MPGYSNIYKTMASQVKELIDGGLRGMIYNGDVDMACNFLGDEWFVDSLGYPLTAEWRKWHYNGQIGGWVKHFDNLIYLTVRGSGHMVPGDKPGPALDMLINFIS